MMRAMDMNRRGTWGLMVAGALALTCGDDGGAGTTSAFVNSFCDLMQPCCAMAGRPADGKQCRLLYTAFAPANYNPTAGEACLNALRAVSGQPNYCTETVNNVPACDDAFPDAPGMGSKKPGEDCNQDNDCAPSSEGKVECQHTLSGGVEIRKCQVQVTGKEGDKPCAGTVEGNVTSYNPITGSEIPVKAYLCRTADGLYCDWDTDTCTRFKAVGEACSGSMDCGRGAFCETGKCAARKAAGQMCMGGFGSRQECVDGLFCQESSMTCAAQMGHGAACTESEECKSRDCVNGKCEGEIPDDLGLAFLCGGN